MRSRFHSAWSSPKVARHIEQIVFFITLALLHSTYAQASVLEPRSRFALPRACTATRPATAGRFISFNAGPWKRLATADAVMIGDGQNVSIAVCNERNASVDNARMTASLLPLLVYGIGRSADVRLLVRHSGNLHVSGLLDISDDSAAQAPMSLVTGPVGKNAYIRIAIEDSANILLSQPGAEVRIGRTGPMPPSLSSFMDIRTSNPSVAPAIAIELRRSANVLGSQGTLKIDRAYLPYASLVSSMRSGTTGVHLDQAANVEAGRIEIRQGALLSSIVETPSLERADVRVTMRQSGNLHAHQALVIDHAELIDEPIDAKRIRNSKVKVRLRDSGNVRGNGCVRIDEGELVDETLDAPSIGKSKIALDLQDVANVSAQTLTIRHGELIDEMIDSDDIDASSIRLRARHIGNVALSGDRGAATHSQPLSDSIDRCRP
ncbi:hypothetical protein [Xanthomonas hortorum]|uniref:Uncharacterized protein n=4 Tax=Xanthomonas hortorum TaxID=56454 RepID=A0A6V7D4U8_9XANT|nr:hypothetical protein [Xanthomonas hortorum]EGD18149.1 hypothetical protein XGA_3232 [Xanthomonas hortorum ATCC 19865]CAH2708769.1 hypothetical protein NCPPB1935_13520 [Xanthomonas campestris pv. nigromaculans]APP80923.1 hypothetical protein BJD10_15515 [Xanthomonas hortorum pv. gardneri]KLA97727.1 hypothetical protein SM19410_09730 [Xanthomonas hortorum pv. gardneri]KLA99422.1 hypothetical protein SM17710_09690 [Xanthomonas hortorum pv. gardneri]